jgi:hypothetical protein
MSFLTLTSFNGNGSQVDNFNSYNTTADFSCSFREPLTITPNSYIKLNFFSAYMSNDANKRAFYITSPTFSTMNSQMSFIGKNGVLAIQRLPDGFGAVEPGTKNSYVNSNDYPYIAINNADELKISELHIKIVWEDGSICDNIDNYDYGNNHTQEGATTIGLHIIPKTFNKLV